MTSNNTYSLVLASKSPRRKELVGWTEVPFEIISKEIEEVSEHKIPREVVEDIARQKGVAVWESLEQKSDFAKSYYPVVVSSDTIVCLGETIYGKPRNTDDARIMLLELSGKEHIVYTAVSIKLLDKDSRQIKEKTFSISTQVTFDNISEEILETYLKSGDSLDKAGAYGIQGQGLSFISKINGSYSNVVGFPLSDFLRELKSMLISEGDQTQWKELFGK